MRRLAALAEIVAALTAGPILATGVVAGALAAAPAPASVSYQPPREQPFAAPVNYTLINQRLRREQDAQIRALVRGWCARGTGPAQVSLPQLCREWGVPMRPAETAAGYEAALHGLIWADDGPVVYDAARNQEVRFMGDVTFENGYSTSPYPCAHGAVVTNTPGLADFATVRYGYGCGGVQPVRNWADGSEYWLGGALATSSTIYDYGTRISVSGAACAWGCPVGNYIASFDARTLALKGLTQVTGPARLLSFSSAVAWPGGHWLIGTSQPGRCPALTDCKTGRPVWIPSGSELNPAAWTVYGVTLPASLDLGTVVSPFRSGGAWYAVTKWFDGIGSRLEELTSACMAGCAWHATGRTWPTAGTISYSAQVDSDPGSLTFTYAENDKAWYGLHWLTVTAPPTARRR